MFCYWLNFQLEIIVILHLNKKKLKWWGVDFLENHSPVGGGGGGGYFQAGGGFPRNSSGGGGGGGFSGGGFRGTSTTNPNHKLSLFEL